MYVVTYFSLCSAGLFSSSATVISSHTTPASSSNSSQPNSIFLSQHFSSSLQLQTAECGVCDFLHVQETCGYELARNDCREVNGSSCGKNHLTSIRTFYCPIYCRSIRGQEPSFIRVVKLYGNFLYVSAKYSLRLKI